MPRGDGTGPMGAGPMTGRAAGYCAGYSTPGYVNPIPGRGYWGMGRGGFGRGGAGRGRRNWYYATGLPGWQRAAYGYPAFGGWSNPNLPEMTSTQEIEMLKQDSELLKKQLNDINERIETLKNVEDPKKDG